MCFSYQQTINICSMDVLRPFLYFNTKLCLSLEYITSPLFCEPWAVSLMHQYRNRFYLNAAHTRRIR